MSPSRLRRSKFILVAPTRNILGSKIHPGGPFREHLLVKHHHGRQYQEKIILVGPTKNMVWLKFILAGPNFSVRLVGLILVGLFLRGNNVQEMGEDVREA